MINCLVAFISLVICSTVSSRESITRYICWRFKLDLASLVAYLIARFLIANKEAWLGIKEEDPTIKEVFKRLTEGELN